MEKWKTDIINWNRITPETGSEHPTFRIENKELVDRIIKRTSKRRKYNIKIRHILPLYQITSDELKENIKQHVLEEFTNNTAERIIDWDLFFESIKEGVIEFNFDSLVDKYLEEELTKNKGFDDINIFRSVYRFDFLQIYYNEGCPTLTSVNNLLSSCEIPEFLRWIFSPATYEYDSFKIEWLLIVANIEIVMQRLGELKISALEEKIKENLKEKYDPKLSDIYWKYFS